MDDFSFNQIKQMEQEALRLAKLSKERQKSAENGSKTVQNGSKTAENNQKKPENHSNLPQKTQKRSSFSFLNALDIKKLIGENSEQALLLLLILILSHDNTCDEYLLYALIYIML